MFTDKLFTGQQEMAGLGIYNYGARFYSPKLGRFLSADTIVPNLYNPQDLNRFSYVRNSPLNYIDPTGHDPYSTCGGNPACIEYVNKHPEADFTSTWGKGKDGGTPDNNDDGGGNNNNGGKCSGLCIPTDDTISGGDSDVGYDIYPDVGVAILNYYGTYQVINLNEAQNNGTLYQNLIMFEQNADKRKAAKEAMFSSSIEFGALTVATITAVVVALAGTLETATVVGAPVGIPQVIGAVGGGACSRWCCI
ncbi:MAG: hypothetical protein IPP66_14090 [Anaerolineales bacterium]|nr:hypothetical protein [Anaerolineales bacterium]